MTGIKPELVMDTGCVIGEGPFWDSDTGRLIFIDVRAGKVFRAKDGVIEKTAELGQSVGFAVPRERGGLVAGTRSGFCFTDFDGAPVTLAAVPEAGRNTRFNDGKADPAGRIWGGTMPLSIDTGEGEIGPECGLYCMDGSGRVKTMLTGVIQGNGLGWTADSKRFYFIDTERHTVQGFDYDIERNELSNGSVCVEIPVEMGIPDGMAIDDEGMLWVALWGGWAVRRYDPRDGRCIGVVEMPVPNVTSCCFGGAGLDELYITTAGINTDLEKYPQAGGVFRARPGVTGRPSYKYKG